MNTPTPDAAVPANFDRVARLYRWGEYALLGPMLERTRNHLLPLLSIRQRALVLGDGDGRFLARLLGQNPSLHALAVDTSGRMLDLLRHRCDRSHPTATSRLQTLQADARDVAPPRGTDLVVTHFFLDCLSQADVEALATRCAAAMEPGSLWLLSDFAIPNHRALRPLARCYIRSLYLAFRVLTGLRVNTLPAPARALATAGFRQIGRRQRLFGLLYTELWQRR